MVLSQYPLIFLMVAVCLYFRALQSVRFTLSQPTKQRQECFYHLKVQQNRSLLVRVQYGLVGNYVIDCDEDVHKLSHAAVRNNMRTIPQIAAITNFTTFKQTTLEHRKQIRNLKIGVKGYGMQEETQKVAEHNMETV